MVAKTCEVWGLVMAVSKDFVLAGNATFTIEVPADFADANGYQLHYTYKVQQPEATKEYPNPCHFIKLLTGPDNVSSYSYLGILDAKTGAVKLTAKSKLQADSVPVKLLGRILARVWADEHQLYEAHGFRTHHEGKCGCCGRKLTTPESLASGLGPICEGRITKGEAA